MIGVTDPPGLTPRAFSLFYESLNCSKSLFFRMSGRKTGVHFSWTRSSAEQSVKLGPIGLMHLRHVGTGLFFDRCRVCLNGLI